MNEDYSCWRRDPPAAGGLHNDGLVATGQPVAAERQPVCGSSARRSRLGQSSRTSARRAEPALDPAAASTVQAKSRTSKPRTPRSGRPNRPNPGRPGVDRPPNGHPNYDRPPYGRPRPAISHAARRRYRLGAYNRPSGYYSRQWTMGAMLPSLFRAQPYWLTAPGAYALRPPPPGTRWVRVDYDGLVGRSACTAEIAGPRAQANLEHCPVL